MSVRASDQWSNVIPSPLIFFLQISESDLHVLLHQVLEEIERHGIDIYQYPDCDSDEDEEFKQQDKNLKVSPYIYT